MKLHNSLATLHHSWKKKLVKAIKKQELTLTSSYNHCVKHPNKKKMTFSQIGFLDNEILVFWQD
jgi:hypothetical protein